MKRSKLLFLIFLYVLPLCAQQSQEGNQGYYQFDGKFSSSSAFYPFSANPISDILLFEDTAGTLTFDYIKEHADELLWQKASLIKPKLNTVYWIKTRLIGSSTFNGDQMLHVAPLPGKDRFSYDHIDVYMLDKNGILSHQRTGNHIPQKDRPYDFWATFIKLNIQPDDMLDVYIRLDGADPYLPMPEFKLWHVDASSVFPRLMNEAIKKVLFYGILGIQILFFICLYFIEKARVHLIFAALILGLFLAFAFTIHNYSIYVPFPTWKDYQFPLFYLGIFMTSVSMLKFAENYFDYPRSSVFSKKVIPVFTLVFAVVDVSVVVWFRLHGFDINIHIIALIFALSFMVPFIIMAIKAKGQQKVLKRLFFVAFIPVFLSCIPLMGVWSFISKLFGNFTPEQDFLYRSRLYDFFEIAIIFMLVVFALSIGYRTRFLKSEKIKAQRQNIADQQTIIKNLQETDHLKEVDQLKTRFYTNITHEFRTPLTVILGMCKQLASTPWIEERLSKDKEGLSNGFQLIERNANKLLGLINQLLDLSKLDSNNLKPRYQTKEVVSFLQYVGESFESLAERKGVRLSIYSEVSTLEMDIDEDKFQQIISNLLSNAIKFTPERGKVVLHVSKKERQLQIKVRDTGEGIAKDALPHIFDRFYQVETTSSRRGEGTGIGLSLVKELVEILEGKIVVESTLGKGAEFTVLFPIRKSGPVVQTTFEENKRVNSSPNSPSPVAKNSDSNTGIPETVPTDLADSAQPPDSLPQLLIVEDNYDVLLYMQSFLTPLYHIQTAADGQEGIEMALDQIPDIIISDVMMPKKDGFELVETLKQDERSSHIPIILLTAKATQREKLTGLRQGADAYLMKPFDKDELLVRLEKLLEVRKVMQERYSSISKQGTSEGVLTSAKPTLSKEELFLQKLKNIVLKHLDNSDLNTEMLCTEIGLNTQQLYRKFKALTNEAPNAFIRTIRLQEAMKLLQSSDLSVSEVAYSVGFNDANYFSRAFNQYYGKAPSYYRK